MVTDGLLFHALGEAQAAIRRRAERDMQPYLARLAEAQEHPTYEGEFCDRLQDALGQALASLGVQR